MWFIEAEPHHLIPARRSRSEPVYIRRTADDLSTEGNGTNILKKHQFSRISQTCQVSRNSHLSREMVHDLQVSLHIDHLLFWNKACFSRESEKLGENQGDADHVGITFVCTRIIVVRTTAPLAALEPPGGANL